MRGQWLFCTTIAIPTSQNTFENRFTLVRNVSEKCNREMTRGINARDEPTCHAVVAVARSLALFKLNLAKQRPHGINSCYFSCGIWFQKWQNLHLTSIMHWGVEAVDGLRFNQKQRRVRSGVSLFSSKSRLRTFWGGGQVCDKGKQYNLYNPASNLRNIIFRKV